MVKLLLNCRAAIDEFAGEAMGDWRQSRYGGGFGWFEMVKDEVVEWSRVRSERW
jgi:hypothetical protein